MLPELFKIVNTTLVNPVVGSVNLKTGEVESYTTPYKINIGSAIFFAVFFGIATALHLGQAIRYRIWWLLWTLGLGAAGETLGWGARVWAAKTWTWVAEEGGYWTSDEKADIIQAVTLIISPAFLAAGNYLILGLLVAKLGIQYSRLTPRRYIGIFVTADILSLLIQSFGAGTASGSSDDASTVKIASYVIMGGIYLQIAAMLIFAFFLSEFIHRFFNQRPLLNRSFSVPTPSPSTTFDRHSAKLAIIGMSVANGLIFVRSVFRAIEFTQGWNGSIQRSQAFFSIFDGTLVLFALYALVWLHPGRLVGAVRIPRARELEQAMSTSPVEMEGLRSGELV